MEIKNRKNAEPSYVEELAKSAVSRRKFLHFSGIFGATTIVVGSVSGISGCKKDDAKGVETNAGIAKNR